MSPSRIKPSRKLTVLMGPGRKKGRAPAFWKESEKPTQSKGRGDGRRKVDSTLPPFHPFVGRVHTSSSTYTSTEGSTEGPAELWKDSEKLIQRKGRGKGRRKVQSPMPPFHPFVGRVHTSADPTNSFEGSTEDLWGENGIQRNGDGRREVDNTFHPLVGRRGQTSSSTYTSSEGSPEGPAELLKDSEKPIQRKGRGDGRREVDITMPLVRRAHHTSSSTFTSANTADPTNNFEGSVGGSAEGSGGRISEVLSHVGPRNRELTSSRKSGRVSDVEGSGVGRSQDSNFKEHVGPRNRELTSSRRSRYVSDVEGSGFGYDQGGSRKSGRDDAVESAQDEKNIEGSGVDDDRGQASFNKDDDEDDFSGVQELTDVGGDRDDVDHERSVEIPSVYDSIEVYPGIGTTVDSNKNYRNAFRKSKTSESFDEDEYAGKDEGSGGRGINSYEEDIGSDGEEDSDEDPGDDDDLSSDTEDVVSDEDMGSGEGSG